MSLLALVLVCISAFTHAGWNLIGKRRHPSGAFFLVAHGIGMLFLLPAVAGSWPLVPRIPASVWIMLVCTGLSMAVYYAALGGAYRAGDISIAYPLARSSPVIVVTIVTIFLGRGDQVSVLCIAGIALVVAGCFILPLHRFRDFHPRQYLNACCLFALVAAFGTAGYSIFDDESLRILRNLPGDPVSRTRVTLLYAFLEAVFTSAWLMAILAFSPRERRSVRAILRGEKAYAAAAGFAIFFTYCLVLIAFGFARNVSYVVAFRQLSIPIGAALGVWLLKEPCPPPRTTGIATMLVGLVLVAIG